MTSQRDSQRDSQRGRTGERMSKLRLFVFTFGDGYGTQQAVVMATSRNKAIELLILHAAFTSNIAYSIDRLKRYDDTDEIIVIESESPAVFTYGCDG
jgi:hypothetical protein